MPSTAGKFSLSFDGEAVDEETLRSVIELTIENNLHIPDMGTVRIEDEFWSYVNGDKMVPGALLEVKGGLLTDTSLKRLFIGEVTSVEWEAGERDIPVLVLRALDKRHRLHRGRYTQTFVQKKDSQIVQDIATAAQFTSDVDDTSEVHDWVIQQNQTHWEFLYERARLSGCRLYLDGEKKLCFKKPADSSSDPIELTWGKNLFSFRPRLSSPGQVDDVTVRSWDPKTKQAIVGTKSDTARVPTAPSAQDGASSASQSFGAAQVVVVHCPVASQAVAENLAGSIYAEIGGSYLLAEGECAGNSAILPLSRVKILKMPTKFCGTYEVTATTHSFTRDTGYVTGLSATATRADVLFSTLDEGWAARRESRGSHVAVGVVTDLEDPDDLGRVKVKYPWLSDTCTSSWVRQASVMGGSGRGLQFLPEIDDEVLVAFEHGDLHRPYIIGALWNGVDKPIEENKKAVVNKKVVHRIIKSRVGHTLLMDDTDEKGLFSLTTKGEHQVVLSDVDECLTVKSKSGHTVVLDDKGKKITVIDSTGKNSVTLNAGDNSLQIQCEGDLSLIAKGKVQIKGDGGVNVTTQAALSMKGDQGMDMNSSGMMILKGQMIKLN